jgi:hypothetical protein
MSFVRRLTVQSSLVALAAMSASEQWGSSSAYADGKRDYYIQQAEKLFYGTATNARQVGQGRANDVTSTDSSAVVNNPAALGADSAGDISVTYGMNEISGNQISNYAEIEDDVTTGQVLVSVPLEPTADGSPNLGKIGLGWTGQDSDSDDSVNTEGTSNQVHGSYGIEVDDGVSLGYGLTWFDTEQETDVSNFEQTNGYRHNFGVYFTEEDYSAGATFFFADGEYDLEGLNPDGSVSADTSDYKEHGFEVGASQKVTDTTRLSVAGTYQSFDVDGAFVEGAEDTHIGGNEGGTFFSGKLGVEEAIDENLFLRAGYRYLARDSYFFGREDLRDLNGSAKTNAYSAGVGLVLDTGLHYFPKVNLDYGAEYRDIAYGDWEHVVTLSFPFTLCEPS